MFSDHSIITIISVRKRPLPNTDLQMTATLKGRRHFYLSDILVFRSFYKQKYFLNLFPREPSSTHNQTNRHVLLEYVHKSRPQKSQYKPRELVYRCTFKYLTFPIRKLCNMMSINFISLEIFSSLTDPFTFEYISCNVSVRPGEFNNVVLLTFRWDYVLIIVKLTMQLILYVGK